MKKQVVCDFHKRACGVWRIVNINTSRRESHVHAYFLKLLQTTTAKWWMTAASSSHWLFTVLLHTVTLMPHHVTSEHFRFIHVSPLQPYVSWKCMHVCVYVDSIAGSSCYFPLLTLVYVFVCVSSTRLDATHLSNVLTLEQMWISKRACQSMTAYSCCWLLYAGFPMLHGSCTATESCLKCYCRIFSSIEERKQHQRGCRCNFKMINFWSHNCCLGSCWFFTGIILNFHELAKSVNACSEYQHLVWFIVQHWIPIELILFLFLHLHLCTGVLPYILM